MGVMFTLSRRSVHTTRPRSVHAVMIVLLSLPLTTIAGPLLVAVGQPGALDLYPPSRTGWFPVPRDHFRYDVSGSTTFPIKYLVYDGFAANNATAPVLYYCGNEGAVELFYNNSGALFSLASSLGARLLFAEHRYYGASLPFGAESFTSANLGLLSIEQALADYAALLLGLPSELGCRSTRPSTAAGRRLCDVMLFGGSYGGMLAAWHRVRYPQLSLGAVASGAPVDFYPGDQIQQRFAAAVNHTFDTYGGHARCAASLAASLAAADAATPAQLEAAGVRACGAMGADAVERYAFYARGAMASLAMLDYPYACGFVGTLPANPVHHACAALTAATAVAATATATATRGAVVEAGVASSAASKAETEAVASLRRLHTAVLQLVNATGALGCVDLAAELVGGQVQRHLHPAAWGATRGGSDLGVTSWNYQACTELPLEPITSDGFGFYPERAGRQRAEISANCAARFGGVRPRPGWMGLAFGLGADYRHHSRILFVENEKDPWHVGTASVPPVTGVGGTVRRHVSIGGAHHQELRFASPLDTPGVVEARRLIEETVRDWLRL